MPIPNGTTKEDEKIEDLLAKVLKTNKDMSGFASDTFKLANGDKGIVRKLLEAMLKVQKTQKESFELQERFGKDFKAMIKYVKVMSESPTFKKNQDKINKAHGKDVYDLQNKNFGKSLMDFLVKDKNWAQAATGIFPSLAGSHKKGMDSSMETLDEGWKGRSKKAEKSFFDSKNKDKEPEDDGSLQPGWYKSMQERDGTYVPPYKMGKDEEDPETSAKGQSGSSLFIEQYGSGKAKPTLSGVAKLPFLISGPSLLIYNEIKSMSDILTKMQEDEEWDQLQGDKGGGGIEGMLAGGVLESLIPLLVGILPELLIALAAAGVIALLIKLMADSAKKRDIERDKLIEGSGLKPEDITKAAGGQTDLESTKLAIYKLKGKGVSAGEAIKAGQDSERAGNMTMESYDAYNEAISKAPPPFTKWMKNKDGTYTDLKSRDSKKWNLTTKEKDTIIMGSEQFKTSATDDTMNLIDVDKRFDAYLAQGKSFNLGSMSAQSPGYKKGEHFPAQVAVGETIIPTHDQGFAKDMEHLLDRVLNKDNNKKENPNAALEKQIEMMLLKFDSLIKINEKGNDLLKVPVQDEVKGVDHPPVAHMKVPEPRKQL